MKRADHHSEAERLLSEARKEQDSIRRSLILAEAQVHATLALGDPGEISPASAGQDQAPGTKSTGAAQSGMPKGGGPDPGWPAGLPYPPSAPGGFPGPVPPELPSGRFFGREAGPDLPVTRPVPQTPPSGTVPPRPCPSPATEYPWQRGPARPARRRPAPDDPDEEEPGEEEPDDPGEEEPGAPGKPKPGPVRPF